MRWAATRQTNRLEDTAYCLLGLFNVNMPLLYGKGTRAFVRLQEQILLETDDQSIFLWGLPPVSDDHPDALYGLLAESPTLFWLPKVDHIQPLPPSELSQSAPSTVTSQGLRTTMLLVPTQSGGEDEFRAVLDCIVWKSQRPSVDLTPCIVLKRLWGDQFARVTSPDGSGVLVLEKHLEDTEGAYHNIYVKQSPFYALPQILVRPDWQSPQVYPVIEAYPPESWDASLSMIRAKEPRSWRVIAVLRFGWQKKPPIPLFDVAVGLRRAHGQWTLCYEKHPWSTDSPSLKAVFLRSPVIGASELPDTLQFVTVRTTEKRKRGRRFLELEIFLTAELPTVTVVQGDKHIESMESATPGLADEIRAGTRMCCRIETDAYEKPRGEPHVGYVRIRQEVYFGFRRSLPDTMDSDESPVAPEYFSALIAQLEAALRQTQTQTVRTLITEHEGVIEEDYMGLRPVYWAVLHNFLPGLDILVSLGADLTAKTPEGLTPVLLAVTYGRSDMVYYLMERGLLNFGLEGAEFTRTHDTDTREAVWHFLAAYSPEQWVHPDMKKVLQRLRQVEPSGGLLFYHKNWLGELPLHRAVAVGCTESFQELKRHETGGVLYNACDDQNRSVLFHAACGGNEEIIRELVNLGALVDLGDDLGRSPLHAAVMASHPQAVQALLQLGATVDIVMHAIGLTPLHLACLYGFGGCVDVLRGKDARRVADVNKWTTEGVHFQPLHLAVANGWAKVVSRLVAHGGNCTNSACNGYLKASRSSLTALVEGELVMLGESLTALELAESLGWADLASLLGGKKQQNTIVEENEDFDWPAIHGI